MLEVPGISTYVYGSGANVWTFSTYESLHIFGESSLLSSSFIGVCLPRPFLPASLDERSSKFFNNLVSAVWIQINCQAQLI